MKLQQLVLKLVYRVKSGVSWWLRRLKIWHCHCCGPGASACQECAKKKKQIHRKKQNKVENLLCKTSKYIIKLYQLKQLILADK